MLPPSVQYGVMKLRIEQFTGLEKDALHVHAALIVYIGAVFLFRNSRRSRFPWLLILAVEIVNEALDVRRHDPALGPFPWGDSAKDLWNTMLWPTVLLVLGRYTNWFARRPPTDP
jgi:hypothetical protein